MKQITLKVHILASCLIARCAKCISIQQVECLFSSAALIANGKRSSLKPYKLEQILFVHDNFPLARDSFM